jgi:hypothetical protein
MSALRKPDYLTGGYKMAFLKLMARILPSDEHLLLFLLVDHVSLVGCFPSLETLADEAGWSVAKVRRVRDRLAAANVIGFVSGSGHQSTRYSIPGLFAHTAALKEKKAARVPEKPVEGAAQGGTEPCNPSLNRKEDGPDLRIVPNHGWAALVFQASEKMRRHWLPHVELVAEGPDGIRLRTAASLYADRIKRELEGDGELHAVALSLGIMPEKVTIETARHGRDPLPPDQKTVPLTRAGQEEMAEAIENKPDKPVLVAYAENTVSLEAYRTRRDDALREMDDGGVPVGDAEVARPQQPDAGPERPHQGGDSGDGAGRTARQDAPCRDGGETQPGLEAGGVSDRGTRDGGDRGAAPPPAQHQPAVPALEDTVTQPLGEHHEQHDDDRPG